MREEPLMRKVLLLSSRLLNLQEASFSRILIVTAVCFAVFDLQAQIPVPTILTPQAKSQPAEQVAPPNPSPAPPPVQAIPLPQIADQAEALDQLLREVSKRLSSAPELSLLSPEAKAHEEEISQSARETEEILGDIPNL